jgi:hypothetical protein
MINDCQLFNIFVFVNKLLLSVYSVSYCLQCGSKQNLLHAVFLLSLFFSLEAGGDVCVPRKHQLTSTGLDTS